MQKELEELQPQLVVSAEENSKMLVVIEKESGEVEATSKQVKADEAVANEQAAQAQALKDECEEDLAEAIPALEAAIAALNTLKVKSLKYNTVENVSIKQLSISMFVSLEVNHTCWGEGLKYILYLSRFALLGNLNYILNFS